MEGPVADFCPAEKNCLKWVETYLKDCVCSRRDQVSLTLGLMSVFSWGIAEVPQILTNFKEKSTEGVSLLFLTTWVVGDLFNVAGCYLEPATLPTQFYMALLYTITTVVLVGQTVYYDYIRRWFSKPSEGYPEAKQTDTEEQKPTVAEPTTIRVPSSSRDLYYTSARSLASSYTPTLGSYNLAASHGGSYLGGSHDHHHSGSYLLAPNSLSAVPSEPGCSGGRKSSPGSSVLRMATSAGTLVVGSIGLSSQMGRSKGSGLMALASATMVIQRVLGDDMSVKGEVFGWIMAAIYMGGRVPQIWLNMQRGTVEGLNPLMFMFALVGNLTYVGRWRQTGRGVWSPRIRRWRRGTLFGLRSECVHSESLFSERGFISAGASPSFKFGTIILEFSSIVAQARGNRGECPPVLGCSKKVLESRK